MRCARVFLAVVALQLGGRVASADEPPASVVRHRLGVDVGVASALGFAGLGYQIAPVPWLRMEAAVGLGATGTQLSLMPKLAIGSESCVVIFGLGASLAVYGTPQSSHGPEADPIPWLNLDAPGIECRSDSGVSFQATFGLTMSLAKVHYDIADIGDTLPVGSVLPQVRAGLGWWFY
jgi:hypothetical protein